MRFKRLLVTGGAGFIGSSFIRTGLEKWPCERIVNLDLLTYAADLRNLCECENDSRYRFVQGDICDTALVEKICLEEKIEAIVHFAAQTHVDRSIQDPREFFHTNVQGTLSLLEVVRAHREIHFHHISTDEVYGSQEEGAFSEKSPYRPNSPYAASKAASDHCVRAYAHTYDLSTTLSHCSNNYGPGQHVEKFIPHMLSKLLTKMPLPIYGQGLNVRDWIFVDDHSEAVFSILDKGRKGEVYDIGGECELRNIDAVHQLIDIFKEQAQEDTAELRSLIRFVTDRPGHDLRYAIDIAKIKYEIGWSPLHTFPVGLNKTVSWYLKHKSRIIS
jgi:dTDP-glucose 4,6-dehydratase